MLRTRYRRIVAFFARILFIVAICEILLPRLGLRKWSEKTRDKRLRKVARQFRILAIQLGGVMIKVGQFLSSRVDVLPEVITEELAGLQDEVPPENFVDIRQLAESELGALLSEKYAFFDEVPLAAASLGQAHLASLWLEEGIMFTGGLGGEDSLPIFHVAGETADRNSLLQVSVVVKIQRPGIEHLIATDLAALDTVGHWLRRYPPIRRRVDIPKLLEEFSRILYEEIDYLAEGSNAEAFAHQFKDYPGVRIPRVAWSHTTKRVLTLEDVRAIKITDYDTITAAGIDRVEVASRLLDIYLKQIFEDGFFHADPHPGNLFVRPLTPDTGLSWELTLVDFGMVGHIPDQTRQALREMLVAVGTKDAARLVKSYQMLGVLLPGADLELLEKAEEKAFERFWGKSMSELRDISPEEVLEFAREFRHLIYTMPFQVPRDIIFLGRTVGILSGMCTGLNPEFNVWANLAPYAQKLISAEVSSAKGFWLDEIGTLVQRLLSIPGRAERVLARLEKGEFTVRDIHLAEQVKQLEGTILRTAASILFAAMLLGGGQFFLGGQTPLAAFLWFGALLTLLWIIWPRRKHF